MDEPFRFIGAVQVGITIFSILVGAIGESLISDFFDPYMPHAIAFILSFSLLTWLTVVFGELIPKTVTLQTAEPVARVLAPALYWFSVVFGPVISLMDVSARAVTRPFGFKPAPAGIVTYTREDIIYSVRAAEDVGEIEEAEEEMLYKVFDFADKEVSEVMVPRPEVTAISVDLPPEEALAALIDSPYTRYPAYRGSLDEIVGVLHVRDLFSALHDRGIEQVDLGELVRPLFVVPETKDLGALLADFRRTKQHMAIVVDEYGAMEGIVTLEDVLEEIVGEIEDEFDLPDESVERLDEQHDPDRRDVPDRRLQRAVRDRAAGRGLPHRRRLRLRPARARAGGRRRGRVGQRPLRGGRGGGLADRAAPGRVPARAGRGRLGRGLSPPSRRRTTGASYRGSMKTLLLTAVLALAFAVPANAVTHPT